MLTVCTKGLRVTQFQFSVCMYCTCGRIDNKTYLTWLDLTWCLLWYEAHICHLHQKQNSLSLIFISFGSASRRHQSVFGANGWHHQRSLAVLCVLGLLCGVERSVYYIFLSVLVLSSSVRVPALSMYTHQLVPGVTTASFLNFFSFFPVQGWRAVVTFAVAGPRL